MMVNAQSRDDGTQNNPDHGADHKTPLLSGAITLNGFLTGLIPPGTVLNNAYRIEKRIGEGGMGEVYLATHLALQRSVAVKVIHPSAGKDDVLVQRFLREARLLSQFNHPNIVTLLDFGATDPHPTYFLVLEYLQGETLQDYVARRRPIPLGTILEVMREVCAGVGAAHQHQVVHRDLKPANVFLVPRAGRGPAVKILDFGLAKPVERAGENPLTVAGVVVGTCGYTAPEQLQGKDADVRSDVYSLGGILYYLTAGVAPYRGETSHSIIIKQATEPPPSIDFVRLGIPEAAGLRVVLNKALSRDPEHRYQTAAELMVAVETMLLPLVQTGSTPPPTGTPAAGWSPYSSGVTKPAPSGPSPHLVPAAPAAQPEPPQAWSPYASGVTVGAPASPPAVATPAGFAAGVTPHQSPYSSGVLPPQPPPPPSRRGTLLPMLTGAMLGMSILSLTFALVVWQFKKQDPTEADPNRRGPRVAASGGVTSPPPAESRPALNIPGVTETEVLFGMTGPFSGPVKEHGRAMSLGIDTFFARLNAEGGVHGRKLRLLPADDGYEPERAKAQVRTLLEQDHVFGFVGNVGAPTNTATVPLIVEQKRVLFGPPTGAEAVRRDPPDRYVFNYRCSYVDETAAIVGYLIGARKVAPEKIAVFGQTDAYGDSGFAGVAKALRKYGVDPANILRVGYVRNSGDVSAATAALLRNQDKVEAIVMPAKYQAAAKLIKAVRDGGLRPVFACVSAVDAPALAELLVGYGPEYADGVIVTQVVPDPRSAASGVRRFREDLKRFRPSETADLISLEGYVVAQILAEGLRRAGPRLTPDALVEGLEQVRDLDLGIGAIISFGPSRHQATRKVWGTVLTSAGEYQPLDLE